MDVHVRPARPGDAGRLLELWEHSVRATHHFLAHGDVVALRPLVAAELKSDAIEWWVLVSAPGEPIGFLGLAGETIEGLFVDPQHHRRGGGRLLVAHAQTLLGAGALKVDVNEQNPAALRFYRSLGFSVVGRSPSDAGGRPFPILHMRREASGPTRPLDEP